MDIQELRTKLTRTILEAKDKPEKIIEKYLNTFGKKALQSGKYRNNPILVKTDKIKFEKAVMKKGSKGNVITLNVKDFPIHSKGKDFVLSTKDETITITEERDKIVMTFIGYTDALTDKNETKYDSHYNVIFDKNPSGDMSEYIINKVAYEVLNILLELVTNKEILVDVENDLDNEAKKHKRYVRGKEEWRNKFRDELIKSVDVSTLNLNTVFYKYIKDFSLESTLTSEIKNSSETSSEDRSSAEEQYPDIINLSSKTIVMDEKIITDDEILLKLNLLTSQSLNNLSNPSTHVLISSNKLSVKIDTVIILFIKNSLLLSELENKSEVSFDDYKSIEENLNEFTPNEADDLTKLAKDKKLSLTGLTKGHDISGDGFSIDLDGEEYSYFASYEEAEEYCKEYISDMIETEGVWVFNKEFVMQHIDKDKLGQDLDQESSSEYDEGYDNPESYLDNEEPKGEDGDWTDEQREQSGDKASDDFSKRVLEDPLEYLEEIYGGEFDGFDFTPYIDEEDLIEEAIEVDGVAHFLSSYDGNEIELINGVAYRTN